MHPITQARARILQLIGDAFPALRRIRRQHRWVQAGADRLYSKRKDPFQIEDNPYVRVTFAHIMEVLDDRYGHGLEVGCSEGCFTELLSTRCDNLLAIDISQVAVDRAQKRLTGEPHVTIERRTVPEELPEGPFDLIICSEVLYYIDVDRLGEALRQFASMIKPGGTFVALHYLGDAGGVISGDEVHQLLREAFKDFRLIISERRTGVGHDGAGYQLDRYDRIGL